MRYYDDELIYDDDPDSRAERAYDLAVLRHAKAQRAEDRDTGFQLEPMPSFDDWISPREEDDDA